MTAVTQATGGSLACGASKASEEFPAENEERKFNISFSLLHDGSRHQYQDSLSCHYKGSFCGGGKWFHVWRESKQLGNEWELSSGDVLTHHYYSYCAFIERYEVDCQDGECSPEGHFKFVLKRANAQHPLLVTIPQLQEHGVAVENYAIVEVK